MPALPTPIAATGTRTGHAAAHVATAVAAPAAPRPQAGPNSAAVAATTLATSAALVLLTASPALAADPVATPTTPSEPAALFARNCAGCHAGGGNVVAAGATLLAPDLAAAGLDSPAAVYKLVYGGKGRMPGYGTECAPKGQCTFGPRLSDDDITRLSEYVLAQAAAGWKEG